MTKVSHQIRFLANKIISVQIFIVCAASALSKLHHVILGLLLGVDIIRGLYSNAILKIFSSSQYLSDPLSFDTFNFFLKYIDLITVSLNSKSDINIGTVNYAM